MGSPPPTDSIPPVSLSSCHQLDPIQDSRWAEFVERHSRASVFHTVGWLKALQRTYGYEPVAITTSSPSDDLKNGVVFCRINSWLTGRRLVSLPFSDHCEPLCDSVEEANFLTRYLQTAVDDEGWKYLELRPIEGNFTDTGYRNGLFPSATHYLHTLDLRPDLNNVFRSLDRDSVQRRIERAERAGLTEKCGRVDELLKEFYALFVMTRRRQRVPPTPYAWFRNLVHCQDKALEIRLAYKDKTPIAAILTLQFRDVVYFKYGCSDTQYHKFGAIPWLLWRAISSGKSNGATHLDMGRTAKEDAGLLAFKNHWVPEPKRLVYWRFPGAASPNSPVARKLTMAKRIFSFMPNSLQAMTGRLIYRHIG
jgi:Acetyltransferase (GNAT) domain